mmetsp:Transcript_75487/g.230878  ORF Transcript_75487/g.230878 Transcript_75487/m.230878 type:complete len:263 (+) Transcript_75487:61-849(+)
MPSPVPTAAEPTTHYYLRHHTWSRVNTGKSIQSSLESKGLLVPRMCRWQKSHNQLRRQVRERLFSNMQGRQEARRPKRKCTMEPKDSARPKGLAAVSSAVSERYKRRGPLASMRRCEDEDDPVGAASNHNWCKWKGAAALGVGPTSTSVALPASLCVSSRSSSESAWMPAGPALGARRRVGNGGIGGSRKLVPPGSPCALDDRDPAPADPTGCAAPAASVPSDVVNGILGGLAALLGRRGPGYGVSPASRISKRGKSRCAAA